MKRLIICLAILTLAASSCGGKANVVILNNTSSYVTGDVKGSAYGLVTGGQTRRSVEVGGTFSGSSDVKLNAAAHANSNAASPVVATTSETLKMQADHEYTWEVYFITPNRVAWRLKQDSRRNTLIGP